MSPLLVQMSMFLFLSSRMVCGLSAPTSVTTWWPWMWCSAPPPSLTSVPSVSTGQCLPALVNRQTTLRGNCGSVYVKIGFNFNLSHLFGKMNLHIKACLQADSGGIVACVWKSKKKNSYVEPLFHLENNPEWSHLSQLVGEQNCVKTVRKKKSGGVGLEWSGSVLCSSDGIKKMISGSDISF